MLTAAVRLPWVFRAGRIGFALAPLFAVHLALLAMPLVDFTLTSFIVMFLVTRIAGFGITVGFHRLLSHHAFKTPRWVRFLLAAAGCTAMQKGPLWWVLHHREHHRHSDKEGDPHSPVRDGFWYAHHGWLVIRDRMHPDYRPVRDLAKFPELLWLNRLWMVPGLLLAGVCYLIDGWSGVVYGYCLGVALIFQVTFAVNSLGHLFGPQRFATGDGSRNNWVLGILAMGDGWHNNHHRAPSSARHGFAWYEVDQSYMMIKLMRSVGLAWEVRQPSAEAMAAAGHRPEPVAIS